MKQMQGIVQRQGASNINYSTVIFNFDVCRLFSPTDYDGSKQLAG